jgi:hypothetical protein
MRSTVFTLMVAVFMATAAFAISPDKLIVPGKSVGKIKLGVSEAEVLKLLGKPSEEKSEEPGEVTLTYQSPTGKNTLMIYIFQGAVNEIYFNSPSFKTSDGLCSSIVRNYPANKQLKISVIEGRFNEYRFQLRSGGLTFFEITEEGANQSPMTEDFGVVHKVGKEDLKLGYSRYGEPNGGWKPHKPQK